MNLGVLAAFAVQHTIMARPAFKRRWTRLVHPSLERSFFVLATVLCLALIFWQWRPMPELVWSVGDEIGRGVLWAGFGFGTLILLLSTFLIGHFELFGLAQVWRDFRGQEPAPAKFRQPWLYGVVRHPIMLGILIMLWSQPTMTRGQLLFAAVCSAYIYIGVRVFEERDLRAAHPGDYERYMERVPMLIPSFWKRSRAPQSERRTSDA